MPSLRMSKFQLFELFVVNVVTLIVILGPFLWILWLAFIFELSQDLYFACTRNMTLYKIDTIICYSFDFRGSNSKKLEGKFVINLFSIYS